MALVPVIPFAGILAVVFALWLARDVLGRDTGTPAMQEVAGTIFEGAMAFLRRQYQTIGILAVVAPPRSATVTDSFRLPSAA